jgi:hypothetical protein
MISTPAVHRLNLYRRHRRDCKVWHPAEWRAGELEERKKSWKKCQCPIFAFGSLAGSWNGKPVVAPAADGFYFDPTEPLRHVDPGKRDSND